MLELAQEVHPLSPDRLGRRVTVFNGRPVNVSALADDLGMDQSNLAKVLTGRIQPCIKKAIRIAKALGMTVEELDSAIDARRIA